MFVEEKSKGEVPDFKLGTLRLSTAIREGAKKRPQAFGCFFDKGGSCAMGAAVEAIGQTYNEDMHAVAKKLAAVYPQLGFGGGGMNFKFTPLGKEIYYRNDQHETRESIADWLESKGL